MITVAPRWLQIVGRQPRVLRDAREHLRANLVAIVERPRVGFPTIALQGLVRAAFASDQTLRYATPT